MYGNQLYICGKYQEQNNTTAVNALPFIFFSSPSLREVKCVELLFMGKGGITKVGTYL